MKYLLFWIILIVVIIVAIVLGFVAFIIYSDEKEEKKKKLEQIKRCEEQKKEEEERIEKSKHLIGKFAASEVLMHKADEIAIEASKILDDMLLHPYLPKNKRYLEMAIKVQGQGCEKTYHFFEYEIISNKETSMYKNNNIHRIVNFREDLRVPSLNDVEIIAFETVLLDLIHRKLEHYIICSGVEFIDGKYMVRNENYEEIKNW